MVMIFVSYINRLLAYLSANKMDGLYVSGYIWDRIAESFFYFSQCCFHRLYKKYDSINDGCIITSVIGTIAHIYWFKVAFQNNEYLS